MTVLYQIHKNEFSSTRFECYSRHSGAPACRLIYGTLSKVVNKAMGLIHFSWVMLKAEGLIFLEVTAQN